MRLRRWAVLAGAVAIVAGCARGHEYPGCRSAFPPGVDERCAFTDDLVRLKEAPLWPPVPEAPDAFRLLVHEPLRLPFLIRAVRSRRGWDVVARASWGGNTATLRRTHSVLVEELEGVQKILEVGGFWRGPFQERPELELDPCVWLLESDGCGQASADDRGHGLPPQ